MTVAAPRAEDWPPGVVVLNEAGSSAVVLTCEHASRHIPASYAGLGLQAGDLERHIAWDIGADALTRALSASLDAPAFLGTYSRLLIDLNRPLGSPSGIPTRSEATDIPGNLDVDDGERARRAEIIFRPFHDRLADHLDRRTREGRATVIVAVHSFTPVFLGQSRPWHAGILFSHSAVFARAMLDSLAGDEDLVVAANEPYRIDRDGDYTVPVHGEDRGLPAVLVEIRQDCLGSPDAIARWSDRLSAAVSAGLEAISVA